MEANQVVVALDLYGKEIAHLTLVLYLPSFLKLIRELPVESECSSSWVYAANRSST